MAPPRQTRAMKTNIGDAPTISFLPYIGTKKLTQYSAADAIRDIREGKWKDAVDRVRNAADANAKDAAKKKLPAFLPSGIFNGPSDDGLVKHSGLICLDFDKVEGKAAEIRDAVASDPHTYASFVSPSGVGVKVWVAVADAGPKNHKALFDAVAAHYSTTYSLDRWIDTTGSNVGRLCFVSADAGAKQTTRAQEFHLHVTPTPCTLHLTPYTTVGGGGGSESGAALKRLSEFAAKDKPSATLARLYEEFLAPKIKAEAGKRNEWLQERAASSTCSRRTQTTF